MGQGFSSGDGGWEGEAGVNVFFHQLVEEGDLGVCSLVFAVGQSQGDVFPVGGEVGLGWGDSGALFRELF